MSAKGARFFSGIPGRVAIGIRAGADTVAVHIADRSRFRAGGACRGKSDAGGS